ncbi:MAG: hypothetical protein ACOCX4_09115 [Planctomycetota bacterium]
MTSRCTRFLLLAVLVGVCVAAVGCGGDWVRRGSDHPVLDCRS